MRKNFLLSPFSLALLTDLAGIVMEDRSLQYFSKPLIVLSLLLWFLFQPAAQGKGRMLVVIALLFSWSGDILLLFEGTDFFLAGLSAFLVAHIFYILFFGAIKKRGNTRSRPLLFILVALYYALLISLLFGHLKEMKVPVIIYGAVISTMFVLALHLYYIKNRMAGQLMLAGAAFFVASDSLLAFNKFYAAIPFAGIFIMVTYAVAQFAIVQGAAKYLAEEK